MKKYTILRLKYQIRFDIWEWAQIKNYIEKVIKSDYKITERNTDHTFIEIDTTPDKFLNIMNYRDWLYI